MIVMIDNYDSFTYNLYQCMGGFEKEIRVYKNDQIKIEDLEKLNPSHIIISPGPKYPKDAGISMEVIRHFTGKKPILGVCLGHQSIGEVFGGKVTRAKEVLHGKQTPIHIDETVALFKGLGKTIQGARYHSLIVEKESLPKTLEVIATDDQGEIMALKHKAYPTFGVQFHPESILTPEGVKILKNFMEVE